MLDNTRRQISIHALLAESDSPPSVTPAASRNFYPRSPCGERRGNKCCKGSDNSYFYPRSPCGERPMQIVIVIMHALFLSTLSLRRATDTSGATHRILRAFLSTLSLRRATNRQPISFWRAKHFYPRSPCGERPFNFGLPCILSYSISIHALLAESDLQNQHQRTQKGISIHALLAESDRQLLP